MATHCRIHYGDGAHNGLWEGIWRTNFLSSLRISKHAQGQWASNFKYSPQPTLLSLLPSTSPYFTHFQQPALAPSPHFLFFHLLHSSLHTRAPTNTKNSHIGGEVWHAKNSHIVGWGQPWLPTHIVRIAAQPFYFNHLLHSNNQQTHSHLLSTNSHHLTPLFVDWLYYSSLIGSITVKGGGNVMKFTSSLHSIYILVNCVVYLLCFAVLLYDFPSTLTQ